MKNIHVIATDKPSRLLINWEKDLCYKSKPYLMEGTQNIYITNSEEIKEGDWCIHTELHDLYFKDNNSIEYPAFKKYYKKIILTTDLDLIKAGVQSIPDEFLEWICKNSNCEEVKIVKEKVSLGEVAGTTYIDFNYKIIIPKQESSLSNIKCTCISFEPNCFTSRCRKCGFLPKEESKPYTIDDYFNDEFPKEKPKQNMFELKQFLLAEFWSFCEKEFKADFEHDYVMGKGSNNGMSDRTDVFVEHLSKELIKLFKNK
jgi:hypothetical protein